MDFGLKEPFDIDDGELDGLTLQRAFTLGVEWEMFYQRLTHDVFEMQIHAANEERLTRLAGRHGFAVSRKWVNDDWVLLCAQKSGDSSTGK